MKAIALKTSGGTRYYAVEITGETSTRFRVKVLFDCGVMLPGRRYVYGGEETLVPKEAIREITDPRKLEIEYYDGHIYGYGEANLDAR